MNVETKFELLSSSVRRTVIAVLHETDTIDRRQLTTTVADVALEDGGEDARRRMRVALHHNHLPRLADADLITYDEGQVSATDQLDPVARTAPLPDVTAQIPTRA